MGIQLHNPFKTVSKGALALILNALSFDGVNNYAELAIPDSTLGTLLGTSGNMPQFTICFRAIIPSDIAYDAVILGFARVASSSTRLELKIHASNKDRFSLVRRADSFSTLINYSASAAQFTNGESVHITLRAMTRPSYANPWMRYQIFVNGVSVSSSDFYDAGTYTWDIASIGALLRGSAANLAKVTYEDLRIFNAPLSDGNIANLSSGVDYTTNMIAHWTFDETDEESVNGYDAIYSPTPPTYVSV